MSFGNLGNRRPAMNMTSGFGSPAYSSQTGAKDPIKINSISSTVPKHLPVTENGLLSKRTEHLEKEVKPLKEIVSRGTSEREKLKCIVTNSTKALYAEMQWVYANNVKPLSGRKNWNDYNSDTCVIAPKAQQKLLMVYPMKKYEVPSEFCNAPTTQFLMRCKQVNRVTGQISMHWVVVHEIINISPTKNKHIRYVHSFSFV